MYIDVLKKFSIATTLALAGVASTAPMAMAQVQRSILNESFEDNQLTAVNPGGCTIQTSAENVVGWQTDHRVGNSTRGCGGIVSSNGPLIELWRAPIPGSTPNPAVNVPAFDGQQFAELNAAQASRLYQSICLVEGETFSWTFSHRGRQDGPATQAIAFEISPQTDPSGTSAEGIATSSVGRTGGWMTRTGVYEHTGTSGVQTIGFRAVGGSTLGNFLDGIQISLRPYIEFQPADRTGPESDATSSLPTIRVAGNILQDLTIGVRITGGTAVLGTDYTTPGGGALFNVVIPAGNYDGTQDIPTGIEILEDFAIEGNETITMQVVPNRNAFTIANVEICGAAPRGTMSYTIADNDAALSVSKELSDVRVAPADQFVLNIAGPNGSSTTTSGTGADAIGEVAVTNIQAGTVYTISETMAPGSTSPLGDYIPTLQCINRNTASPTVLPGGTLSSATITPRIGDDISCVFSNDQAPRPSVTIEKTLDAANTAPDPFILGSTISYALSVTNTGNVALTDVQIVDPMLGYDCTIPTLPRGDTVTSCAASPMGGTYTVLQSDIDRGFILNTATVTGRHPSSPTPLTASDDLRLEGVAQQPALSLVKEAGATDNTLNAVGQEVDYTFTVTNTGNITITVPVTINDPLITTAICPALPAAGLGLGESLICTGTYAVTQADLDAGEILNTATASAPNQPTYVPGNPDPVPVDVSSDPASDTVVLVQTSGLTIDKRLASGSAQSFAAVGAEIEYEFLVRNTGNVSLTAIEISDAAFPPDFLCTAGPLAPNGTAVCAAPGPWVATQGDLDAGKFTNIATASGTYTPRGQPPALVTSPPDSVTVNAVRNLSLALDKTIETAPGTFGPGESIVYRFALTNTGNVTLPGPFTVSDPLISATPFQCVVGPLAPGASASCVTNGSNGMPEAYLIENTDLDLGSVTNTATAQSAPITGEFPHDPVQSNASSQIFPVDAEPALTLLKSVAAGQTFSQVGNSIEYTFEVRNTSPGAQTRPAILGPITINDPMFGAPITCAISNGAATLAPYVDASSPVALCTATHIVTQADIDSFETDPQGRPFIVNEATASGSFGGRTIISPPSRVVVVGADDPAFTLSKSAANTTAPGQDFAVGHVATYTLVLENTGNQTLRIANAPVDDMLTGITCAGPLPYNLAVGTSLSCSGTYTITQADVDAQELANTATATALPPSGNTVLTAQDTHTIPLVDAEPAVTIVKSQVGGPGFAAVGEVVTYRFTVENTGNITLNNVVVDDELIAASCPIPGTLAPGQSSNTCTMTYSVTQADLDATEISNTANVTAQPATPGSDPVRDSDTLVINADPAGLVTDFTFEKTASITSFNAIGTEIDYTFTITNTGTLTITTANTGALTNSDSPVIADPMLLAAGITIDCGPWPAGGLAPGAAFACTAEGYRTTLADLDAGEVLNTAEATVERPAGDPVQTLITKSDTVEVAAVQEPAVAVTKTTTATNPVAGDEVTYTFTITNTGNVTLDRFTAVDTHTAPGAPGTPTLIDLLATDAIASLAPNESVIRTAVYTVTQADIDAGGALVDTVEVTAMSPADVPVAGDATLTVPVADLDAAIAVMKTFTADTTPVAIGTVINYTIEVENTGFITLQAPVLTDVLERGGVDTPFTAITPAPVPVLSASPETADNLLNVGESWTYTFAYTVTQADVDAGGLRNAVVASATPVNGDAPVVDTSGTGFDNDTPTDTPIAPQPALTVTKVFDPVPDLPAAGETITYLITVTNTGNLSLQEPALVDVIERYGPYPATLALTSGPTPIGGDTNANGIFEPREERLFTATYTLTDDDFRAAPADNPNGISNTVVATARTLDDRLEVDDISGLTADDDLPTRLDLTVPVFATTKLAGDLVSLGGGRYELPFTITVENQSPVAIRDLQVADDLSTMLGGATLVDIRNLRVTGAEQGGANTAYNGQTVTDLLAPQTRLAGMERLVIAFAVVFDVSSGMPGSENVAIVDSSRTPPEPVIAPVPVPEIPSITAAKTANTDTAIIGQTVTYTLTYRNAGTTVQRDLALVDRLPAGVALVPDSVTLDGAAVTPRVEGRRVTVDLAQLAPSAQAVVVLQARVADLGDSLTNRTWVEDRVGNRISNEGSHTITPRIEAVFQCSDIIGRVFDDRNLNGYLDRATDTGAGISDQSYSAAKWDIDEQTEAAQAEQGLAGVRLFTTTGTVITTDAFGRFSVPCAALPEEMGENFTLSLDESSLPTGYRVTSENPRTIRLSQGTLGWMEFGAALGRVMEIDLTADAFVDGQPRAELVAGIEALLAEIANQPVMLRLTYFYAAEGESVARSHLDAVENLMRSTWSDDGQYRLLIERQVARLQ